MLTRKYIEKVNRLMNQTDERSPSGSALRGVPKHFDEATAKALCASQTWAELQKALHECGLHKTAQELNKVTQTMGWELAELLDANVKSS